MTHPKFGHGIVEKINQRSGGVHLHIRFDGEVKCIDQKMVVAEEVYVKRFNKKQISKVVKYLKRINVTRKNVRR